MAMPVYPPIAPAETQAPAEQLSDQLASGGTLYGSPVQALNHDGSVTIKRPALNVHDSNSARVMKRQPPRSLPPVLFSGYRSAFCPNSAPTRFNACRPARAPTSPYLLKPANHLGL